MHARGGRREAALPLEIRRAGRFQHPLPPRHRGLLSGEDRGHARRRRHLRREDRRRLLLDVDRARPTGQDRRPARNEIGDRPRFSPLPGLGSVPGFPLRRDKLQRHAVVAVALARGLRAVVEHVPLVALAARAMVFGARQDEAEVGLALDAPGNHREEARPSRAALVLHLGGEERQVAAGAGEKTLALLVVERARAGALGRLVAQHRVGLRRQALLPLVVGELQLVDLDGVFRLGGGVEALAHGDEGGEGSDEVASVHGDGSRKLSLPYAVPPTVRPSMRIVGWPTPTGTFWPSLPHMPIPGSRHMSLPMRVTRVSASGPLPMSVAPFTGYWMRPFSIQYASEAENTNLPLVMSTSPPPKFTA